MEPHVNPDAARGLRQVLGDLEAEIMEILWEEGPATVRDVHGRLAQRREIAYTTVMTVMSRLAEKGILERRQEGRAFVYAPVETRGVFCTRMVKNVMAGLFGGTRPALAHFVESLSDDDVAELDELARIIDEKRKERRPSSSSSSS